MQLSNCEAAWPLKENKDVFIFEFCSLMNPGRYMINRLFHGYFTCTNFIHSLSIKIVRAHQPWNNQQLYADLGILRALRLKHCGLYLAQRKFNARIIKINMVEGTNESFLACKLSELKISKSSGPCACIHLLLVSIARSFTLHVYTCKRNKQTLRSCSLSSLKMHLQILKVLILSYRWKRFKIPGGRLFLAPDQ